jgi:hypothetical protein
MGLVTSVLATGLLPGRQALALSGEPFPVFESDAQAHQVPAVDRGL